MRKLGKRVKEIHPYIATPAYDGRVYTDYALSLVEAVQVAAHYGIRVTASMMGNGAFIELCRNTFVQMFLKTDCTHLFFIDADLRFEGRAFVGVLQANVPIAAGMYRRRQEPEDYPVSMAPDPEHGGLWMRGGGWVMCNRVPTGFMCIRRDVVEEMAKEAVIMNQSNSKDFPELPWLFYTKFDEENRFVGEDFNFCDDYVKKYQEPIPVWPDFDFTHAGYKCNFMDFLQRVSDGKVPEQPHDDSTRLMDAPPDREQKTLPLIHLSESDTKKVNAKADNSGVFRMARGKR